MAVFHQIKTDDGSIHKTAFVIPDGHYEYLRVPFGLSNSPAVFQRAVEKILEGFTSKGVLAYMDDILITAKTAGEDIKILRRVLKKVRPTCSKSTTIKTYEQRLLILSLGLRRLFKWHFTIADIAQPIIGADFVANRRLVDTKTQLSSIGKLLNTEIHSITTVDCSTDPNSFFELLKQFQEITILNF